MKKQLLVLALSSLCTLSVNAQTDKTSASATGPYIRVGVGYAFPHAGNTQSTLYNPILSSANPSGGGLQFVGDITSGGGVTSYEYKKASLGSGFTGTIAGGYWFTKNIGLELGVNIGIAPKKYESLITNSAGTYKSVDYAKTPVYMMPAVLLRAEVEKVFVYSRIGVAVNVAGKAKNEVTVTNPASQTVVVTEYSFRTGIGLQGALGLSFPVAKKVSIFVEANGLFISQYLKKGDVVELTSNGIDQLSKQPTAYKEFEYEFDYEQVAGTPRLYEPTKAPSMAVPFSNIGISAGLVFGL